MAITGQTRAQIRSAILSAFTSRLGALGLSVDVSAGSYHYLLADRIAARALGIEGSAEELGAEIDLRTSSQEVVERWASLLGTARGDGTKGRYTVTLTGSSSLTSVELTGRYFLRNGLRYSPVEDAVAMSAGTGTCTIEADDVGTAYELASGDTLKWGSAPAGMNPSVTFAAEVTAAEDEQGDDGYRARVLAEVRSRPASGNPQHLINLVEAHEDVYEAYCYPILGAHASGQAAANTYTSSRLDKPGAVTMLILGPPQGSSGLGSALTHSRARTSAQAQRVREYLLGERNADGTVKRPKGAPLFFAGCDPVDWTVAWPNITAVNVELTVEPEYTNEPAWTGSLAVVSATETEVVVSGDHTDKIDSDVILRLPSARYARGRWVKATLAAANYNGGTGNTTFTLDAALADVPTGTMYPALGNWTELRDAVFGLFDALGPGDVPGTDTVALTMTSITRRRRYPPESWKGRADVTLPALRSAVIGAGGALDVTVVAPASDQTAGPLDLFVLGELKITRA